MPFPIIQMKKAIFSSVTYSTTIKTYKLLYSLLRYWKYYKGIAINIIYLRWFKGWARFKCLFDSDTTEMKTRKLWMNFVHNSILNYWNGIMKKMKSKQYWTHNSLVCMYLWWNNNFVSFGLLFHTKIHEKQAKMWRIPRDVFHISCLDSPCFFII